MLLNLLEIIKVFEITTVYLNGGLKTGLKKPVYSPKCPLFEWSAKSRDITI